MDQQTLVVKKNSGGSLLLTLIFVLTFVLQLVSLILVFVIKNKESEKNTHFEKIKQIFNGDAFRYIDKLDSLIEEDSLSKEDKIKAKMQLIFVYIGFIILAIIGFLILVNKFIIKSKMINRILVLHLLLACILCFIYMYNSCDNNETLKKLGYVIKEDINKEVSQILFANVSMSFLYSSIELLSAF